MKDSTWKDALAEAKRVDGDSKRLQGDYQAAVQKYGEVKAKGDRLVNNLQNRSQWLKFLTALDKCLPPYPDKNGKIHEEPMPSSTNPEKLRRDHAPRATADNERRFPAGR